MKRSDSGRSELAVLASLAPRIVRSAWMGGIALLVGLAGTAALALSTTRLYRSEAVLVFERGVQAGAVGREGESPRVIGARLQDMLISRQRLESVIKEMKLYHKLIDRRGLTETIDEMRKHLTVSNREGYAYRIAYDGESREGTKSVLDRLTASIVDEDTKRRRQEAEDTKRFLDTERKQADEDMKTKEQELGGFLTKHPQLAAETGAAASAGGLIRAADRDRAGAGGGDVAGLELQAAQLEESLAAAGAPRVMIGSREVLADPQLLAAHTRAQTELQAARTDLVEKQMHLTNEHPDMKQAIRRVTAAEAGERRAAAALAAAKPGPAGEGGATAAFEEVGGGRVAALRHALAAVRQQIAVMKSRSAPRAELPHATNAVVAIDTEWTRLNREVSEARERQSQLESRQFQAQLAATLMAAGQGGQLTIADPAFRPMGPVAGGRFKIAMVGGAASALLGLVVVLVIAMFDDRLYGPHDVEGVLPDGIVVVIPKVAPRLPPMEPEPAAGSGAGAQAAAQAQAQAQGKEG
jgi:uncharacterized protein involved in exopolysaccharide biosynthesis